MKTPEDEAFDDIARRQGAWGGGFTAKRQAAMDKINSEFHEEYIKYRTAFPKEYTAPQPAQERHGYDWSMLDAAQKSLCEHMAQIKELEEALSQPEQEPVLWMMPDGNTADKWALQFYGGQKGKPLYTTPPKREWVGLTDEEIAAAFVAAAFLDVCCCLGHPPPWR